jgi:O-antigen biosynthesis protein
MKISVVIPCLDDAPHLKQAVGSVLDQRLRAAEIVIVTPEHTPPLSVHCAAASSDVGSVTPVRVVSANGRNASHARNIGAGLAIGDALLFLDPSDVLGPGVLSDMTAVLRSGTGLVALARWCHLIDEGSDWMGRLATDQPLGQDLIRDWWEGRHYPASTQLWLRRALYRVGGWDERSVSNDDGDIVIRALLDGIPVGVAESRGDESIAFHRSMGRTASIAGMRAEFESRLYVRLKAAFTLRDRDMLRGYRDCVAAAFSDLAKQCAQTCPDLAARASQYARRFGQRRRIAARGVLGPLAWAATAPLRRRPQRPSNSDDTAGQTEVKYGLTTADRLRPFPWTDIEHIPARTMPLVSVVIPTYNRAQLVARALDSVLAQSFRDFEALVIDDGSTDDTAGVVRRYVQMDTRVRYLRQHPNRGVGAARNVGLRESRGELIAFLDSDDYWFPAKLERQVDLMRDAPADVGLVYCGVENVNERGERWLYEPKSRGDVYARLLTKNVVHSGSGVMIRRNVIRTAGFFDERIPAIEDYDYWLRISRSYRFDFVAEPLLRYFDVGGTARKSNDLQANMDARAWFFRKYEAEMRWAGAADAFLLTSAKWHVVPWYGNKWGARRLALRAVAINPRAWDAWRFLVRHTIPEPLRQLVRPLRRGVRHHTRSGPAVR